MSRKSKSSFVNGSASVPAERRRPLNRTLPKSGPVIFIIGPTASGKTDVALALAGILPLEVISCDSMQIYKDMPILSQIPSAAVRRRVHHHLVACLNPRGQYSVARFIGEARRHISGIQRRNKWPVVVGGTGLYVTALLDGLFEGPGASGNFRRALQRRAASRGTEDLYRELGRRDPVAATKIHQGDLRRIVRALEVIHFTGRRYSEIRRERQGIWHPSRVFIYGLGWDRSLLYQRIHDRVDRMVRRGLFREAARVIRMKPSRTARGCLGIPEAREVLSGRMTREQATDALKQHTRNFAKRQIAWFKRDARIRWISVEPGMKPSAVARLIEEDLWKRLSSSR